MVATCSPGKKGRHPERKRGKGGIKVGRTTNCEGDYIIRGRLCCEKKKIEVKEKWKVES